MPESQTGRMLLSHNFDLADKTFLLSREEFTQVFIDELDPYPDINCSAIDHSHWVVEIVFFSQQYSPAQIGEFCAQALENKRQKQIQPKTHIHNKRNANKTTKNKKKKTLKTHKQI